MARKVFVDRENCIGCSACSNVCPEVFVVKEDPEHEGAFKCFSNDNVDQEKIAGKVQEAIDMCPVQAIAWKEKKK